MPRITCDINRLSGYFFLISLFLGVLFLGPCWGESGNLLLGAAVEVHEGGGSGEKLASTNPMPEGADREMAHASLKDELSSIVFTLPESSSVHAVLIQADADDVYLIEASTDGASWNLIFRAPFLPGLKGLRSRYGKITPALSGKYFRVRAQNGSNPYWVSHVALYDTVPAEWPPILQTTSRGLRPLAIPFLTQERIDIVKGACAAWGTLLLACTALLTAIGRCDYFAKTRRVLFIGTGALSALLWWNLLQFHFYNFIHTWDFYHYYIGAKYAPELGYTRLYRCTALVDAESGFSSAAEARKLRDLETNELESTEDALKNPEICKSHFSLKRWQSFSRDVIWFRAHLSPTRWAGSQKDHGYNATPVWNIFGTALSNIAPATENFIVTLASIDTLLLLAMWFVVWKAFGLETLVVGLIFWGCNYPARYWWTGGSFLRQDWLAWMTIGICCLKLKRLRLGGFLLTYAGLLRIFPLLVPLGIALKALATFIKDKKAPTIEQRKILQGSLLSLLICIPASIAVSGNFDVWNEFIKNSRKHLQTPLTNNMGLKTIVSYKHENRTALSYDSTLPDPFAQWKREMHETFESRKIFYFILIAAFTIFTAIRANSLPDWGAAVLGVGLIPICTELTCYYYSFLLVFALFWKERPMIGVMLAALAWATYVCAGIWERYDEGFMWGSVGVVFFLCLTLLVLYKNIQSKT